MSQQEIYDKVLALFSPEEFGKWWDNYAIQNGIQLDTRLINFAEEVRLSTLNEVLKLFKG